jgi:hypothetical protein
VLAGWGCNASVRAAVRKGLLNAANQLASKNATSRPGSPLAGFPPRFVEPPPPPTSCFRRSVNSAHFEDNKHGITSHLRPFFLLSSHFLHRSSRRLCDAIRWQVCQSPREHTSVTSPVLARRSLPLSPQPHSTAESNSAPFLPCPKDADPSIQPLIDHVLERYVILPSIYSPLKYPMPLQSSPVSNPSNPLAPPRGGRNPFQGYNAKQIYLRFDG